MPRVAVLLLDVHLQVALLMGLQRAERALEGGLLAALEPLVQTEAGLGAVAFAAIQAPEDGLLLAVVLAGAVVAVVARSAAVVAATAVPVAGHVDRRLALAEDGRVRARVVHVAAAGDPVLRGRVAHAGRQLVQIVLGDLGQRHVWAGRDLHGRRGRR